MSFRTRGIVEGFYGPPWSHTDRLTVVERVGALGMNAYMYAPKDDPFHRDRWREQYPDAAMSEFAELAARGRQAGVTVGYAIAPGLDIDPAADHDVIALGDKCIAMLDVGIDWILLALDDIPTAPGLAVRHAALAAGLLERLRSHSPSASLMLCPTEYLGTHGGEYAHDLGRELPTEIDVMWTGTTVCSPTIATTDAAAWRAALQGHDLVIWDNYPVNDATMTDRLHLGPYRGRDPDLDTEVAGILLNPMRQAHASLVALDTAAQYLADPRGYNADVAWQRALDRQSTPGIVGLARACADGPNQRPSSLPLAQLVADVDRTGDLHGIVTELRAAVTAADDLDAAAAAGDPLAIEVAAWTVRLRAEAECGLAATRLLRACADGRVDALMGAAFGLIFAWTEARRSRPVVFGPRFAVYPAVVMHPSGVPAFDAATGVVTDANAIDALCHLALAASERLRLSTDAER